MVWKIVKITCINIYFWQCVIIGIHNLHYLIWINNIIISIYHVNVHICHISSLAPFRTEKVNKSNVNKQIFSKNHFHEEKKNTFFSCKWFYSLKSGKKSFSRKKMIFFSWNWFSRKNITNFVPDMIFDFVQHHSFLSHICQGIHNWAFFAIYLHWRHVNYQFNQLFWFIDPQMNFGFGSVMAGRFTGFDVYYEFVLSKFSYKMKKANYFLDFLF